jgi:uncharacterized protein (TIGR03437 family)
MTQHLKLLIPLSVWAALFCACALAQAPVTILEIQGANWVSYYDDVFDFLKIASNPGIATALSPTKPFQYWTDITDIVSVNGKPARGVWVNTGTPQVRLNPNATPGNSPPQAIADVLRLAMAQHYLEILQPDGTPIGTIMVSGMNFGDPPPGTLSAIARDNLTVTGGTGAFLGARGQAGNAVFANSVTARLTSISEDPAIRRLNGGGTKRLVVHLIPMSRPEIAITSDGPAVYHSDFSQVTGAKPAKAGEVLILRATGLGPTRPSVDPGQPFPADTLQTVNSPLDVTINGQPAQVVNQIGWPGATDIYRIDVIVPDGMPAGPARFQITVAWIAGAEFLVPTR